MPTASTPFAPGSPTQNATWRGRETACYDAAS